MIPGFYFVDYTVDDGYVDTNNPYAVAPERDKRNDTTAGDVLLFQTDNDGDILSDFVLTSGMETAVYLSLFGGNEDDNGTSDNRAAWWANADMDDGDERQISRLQNLLSGIPASSANLKRLNDAALADLAWLEGVSVYSSIPALNRVNIVINVHDETFEFKEEWAIA